MSSQTGFIGSKQDVNKAPLVNRHPLSGAEQHVCIILLSIIFLNVYDKAILNVKGTLKKIFNLMKSSLFCFMKCLTFSTF